MIGGDPSFFRLVVAISLVPSFVVVGSFAAVSADFEVVAVAFDVDVASESVVSLGSRDLP